MRGMNRIVNLYAMAAKKGLGLCSKFALQLIVALADNGYKLT